MIDKKIAIGLIRTSFGLLGEVKVTSFSGESAHFMALKAKEIFLKDKAGQLHSYNIESIRKHRELLLIKLAGIDTPEEGKKLGGSEIWVDRQFASPKARDEYYHADLYGCSVYLENELVGIIKAVAEGHIAELLEIITPEGQVVLVPFIEKYVGTVDIEHKRIMLKEASREL